MVFHQVSEDFSESKYKKQLVYCKAEKVLCVLRFSDRVGSLLIWRREINLKLDKWKKALIFHKMHFQYNFL